MENTCMRKKHECTSSSAVLSLPTDGSFLVLSIAKCKKIAIWRPLHKHENTIVH